MSTTNTPRSDAVLKNLPKDRQHEIWLRRTEGKDDQRSLTALCAWLREVPGRGSAGIKATPRMLSEFLSWYADRLDLQESNDTLEAFEEFLRKQKPGWTADKIRDTAIQFFISQTVGKKDVNQFATVVQLDQNERFGHSKGGFKERELALKEAKSAEEKKSNQQKALEYCLAEAKGTPAEELFAQAFAALKKVRNQK